MKGSAPLYSFTAIILMAVLSACSATKFVPKGQYLLQKNILIIEDAPDMAALPLPAALQAAPTPSANDLSRYIRQQPNTSILFGWKTLLSLYSLRTKKDNGWSRFISKMGEAPVIHDPQLNAATKANLRNRLENLGYYGSQVTDSTVRREYQAKVYYRIRPGRSYLIDTIIYKLPENDTLAAFFYADTAHAYLKPGHRLNMTDLEKETERVAAYLRTKGYYGFTKNHLAFEADTLKHDGTATLYYNILNHSRNADSTEARPHRIYRLRNINVYPDFDAVAAADLDADYQNSLTEIPYKGLHLYYPGKVNILPRTLRRINLLDSGMVYNENLVNATYKRLSSLRLFKGVTLMFSPLNESNITDTTHAKLTLPLLDCNIRLSSGNTQGYKIGMDASSNSNGLIGISPAVSYYHKNIFRGGQWLNLGFMGNFQFKLKDPTRSTEFGATASLSFPRLLFPIKISSYVENLPRTEVSASYNFQKRPEYMRNMASLVFGYNWRAGERLSMTVNPVRFNIVKLDNVSTDFLQSLHDPFLLDTYRDHFDLGAEASLYYTSDPSLTHNRNYFYLRTNFNMAGNLLSLFNRTMKQDTTGTRLVGDIAYSQYMKLDATAVYTWIFSKNHSFAVRAYGGLGLPYGNASTLPLEQQFYAGGANSLRAWQARTVGPGGMAVDTTFSIPNQTGNFKLECNAEYRFKLFWKMEGALFADAGNVWTVKAPRKGAVKDRSKGAFRFSDFYETVAMDAGLGLRLNMDFVIIRLDLGLMVRDPVEKAWISPRRWFGDKKYALQFGIGYPF